MINAVNKVKQLILRAKGLWNEGDFKGVLTCLADFAKAILDMLKKCVLQDSEELRGVDIGCLINGVETIYQDVNQLVQDYDGSDYLQLVHDILATIQDGMSAYSNCLTIVEIPKANLSTTNSKFL